MKWPPAAWKSHAPNATCRRLKNSAAGSTVAGTHEHGATDTETSVCSAQGTIRRATTPSSFLAAGIPVAHAHIACAQAPCVCTHVCEWGARGEQSILLFGNSRLARVVYRVVTDVISLGFGLPLHRPPQSAPTAPWRLQLGM